MKLMFEKYWNDWGVMISFPPYVSVYWQEGVVCISLHLMVCEVQLWLGDVSELA